MLPTPNSPLWTRATQIKPDLPIGTELPDVLSYGRSHRASGMLIPSARAAVEALHGMGSTWR